VARVAVEDALKPGTIVSGKLRTLRVVGQGSMGIVIEAMDMKTRDHVAVKVMSPERARNEEARKRFLREAVAAQRLSSPHVTRPYAVGELDDGTPYLVMEYLIGSTLADLLVREGPPPLDVGVDWVLQALHAVAEAHQKGLVHRDLKPENLFLAEFPDKQPIVKVLDFGTVKDLVSKGTRLTKSGATLGSPAYMPPEQIRADEIDARADVWAMGVTIYEIASGQLPFEGESVPQTLAAILRDQPIPLRTRRRNVPAELEALIECTLSKNPGDRYASAAELRDALASIRATIPRTTRVTRTVRLGQSPTFRRHEGFGETTELSGPLPVLRGETGRTTETDTETDVGHRPFDDVADHPSGDGEETLVDRQFANTDPPPDTDRVGPDTPPHLHAIPRPSTVPITGPHERIITPGPWEAVTTRGERRRARDRNERKRMLLAGLIALVIAVGLGVGYAHFSRLIPPVPTVPTR
jgi:serine/threonine-protein kinase